MMMVAICSLTFMSFSIPNAQQLGSEKVESKKPTTKIQWLSFDEAMRRHKQNPKKIFVDLYTDWCIWCLKMEKATFEHPVIAEYINENFYPVKLDAEMRQAILFKNNEYVFRPNEGRRGVHEMAIYLTRGRLNYPSVVFLDENISNPQPVPGYQNPVRMDKLLKFFGENYYKQVDWGLFNQIYKSPLAKNSDAGSSISQKQGHVYGKKTNVYGSPKKGNH